MKNVSVFKIVSESFMDVFKVETINLCFSGCISFEIELNGKKRDLVIAPSILEIDNRMNSKIVLKHPLILDDSYSLFKVSSNADKMYLDNSFEILIDVK